MTFGDFLVLSAIAIIVFFGIRSLCKQSKSGGCAGCGKCSGGCGSCSTNCGCGDEK